MQVKNKEMYHYHKNYIYKDIWKENNDIKVDNNFNSYCFKILEQYSTSVDTIANKRRNFDIIIDNVLQYNPTREQLIGMLKTASRIIRETNIVKREIILELVRKEKYPNLPSRQKSIYLCEKEQLDFWYDQLGDNSSLDLYKVLITGNLFKSSDKFIPDDEITIPESINQANKYWNPVFKTAEEERRAEYLFQGDLKILKRIKK